jgi:hypothetical protein
MTGNIQQRPSAMAPVERLAATTPDAQGSPIRGGLFHALDQILFHG